jgi:serine/threonine-protein kinase PRP4
LKLCDFGSVVGFGETELQKSDVLVSPFYRPPEVIIGYLGLSGAVDIWSAGVTLFELYTGKFLFTGTQNNVLLK